MKVALVVIGDGRFDYLRRAVDSAAEMLSIEFAHRVMVNDKGDLGYGEYLQQTFSDFDVISHHKRSGLAAAINSAWAAVPSWIDYIFHLEEDFTFPAPVDVRHMCEVLACNDKLANLVLKRQPWSPPEVAAGDVLAVTPEAFTQRHGWVHHRRGFWLNPCVYRRSLTVHGWPEHGGEAEFTERLLADGWEFGYLGEIGDAPRCTHLGVRRSQGWLV